MRSLFIDYPPNVIFSISPNFFVSMIETNEIIRLRKSNNKQFLSLFFLPSLVPKCNCYSCNISDCILCCTFV